MADDPANVVSMDNSGQGPLRVSGFGGTSLYHELSMKDRFADNLCGWLQDPGLTVPEMAMLQLMSDLTDRDNWHMDILNDEIAANWREEVVAENSNISKESMRRISARAWDWCLAELRDKASRFEEAQFVRLMDAGAAACKSDTLVSESLRVALRDNIAPLLEESKARQDHDPNQVLLELVDPMLFPLIYGKSLVLMDGGQVDLLRCFESCGSGELAPPEPDKRKDVLQVQTSIEKGQALTFHHHTEEEIGFFRWSATFQMLPCEVQFGESGTDVQIMSYINNLHPVRYKALYSGIEKLISAAIKPWNECLVKGEKARWPIRIRTFGLTWEPQYPSSVIEALKRDDVTEAFKDAMRDAESFLRLPDRGTNEPAELDEDWDKSVWDTTYRLDRDWVNKYELQYPEPGVSFSYDDWKLGRNTAHIREKKTWPGDAATPPVLDHEFYSINLEDSFREQGLQVIVRIGSMELTPDQQSFDEDWHQDSLLNEHVVATAIYYYDIKNVTETSISFRQRARLNEWDYHYDRDCARSSEYEPDVYELSPMLGFSEAYYNGAEAVQELGSLSEQQGRLITWSNALQYRVEPFTLVDPTIPGHRRFIILSLVDPHYRICSTMNVPPQRQDWAGEADGALQEAGYDVAGGKEYGWVSMDEARRAKEEMERERIWADRALALIDEVAFVYY
ncbi:hypothetical protein V495_06374 [Pseudogymnoascus sp. VKM F-4514 (FW-929)]|nr:hypothetical protein V495_06374 [Pseudogymnoascus sp. VKM F-4514 (FW-929)]KFY54595.1 hypothetical protein V497_07587 [Pseudogymnoascus sp. VKM F-4516 (FW-969)]